MSRLRVLPIVGSPVAQFNPIQQPLMAVGIVPKQSFRMLSSFSVSTACHAMAHRLDAFVVTWAKKGWNCCAKLSSIRLWRST
jgi:hypothetical protein